MAENIEDPTNITGLGTLVNKQHTDGTINLEELERSLIGGNHINIMQEVDPAQEFRDTIKELTADTGINLDDDIDVQEDMDEQPPAARDTSRVNIPRADIPQTYTSQMDDPYPQYTNTNHFESNRIPPRENMRAPPQENMRAQYLNDTMRAYAGANSDIEIEREREEDMKATLLEDIDELISELEAEEVDISRVPQVNQDSTITLIKKVHKILRIKYDRRRCDSLGKETIMAAARGLENVFDGKRKFGPWSPDLTSWHNVARTKISRMRYETSTIVADLMHQYNISSFARILIELIPSAILHSCNRKDRKNEMNYSPSETSAALDDLRQYDKE